MKISKLKKTIIEKPFVDNEKINITFNRTEHKITGITVRNGKKSKRFPVVKDDILSTWKKVEKFFSKI